MTKVVEIKIIVCKSCSDTFHLTAYSMSPNLRGPESWMLGPTEDWDNVSANGTHYAETVVKMLEIHTRNA
jgi:hypothetical protein